MRAPARRALRSVESGHGKPPRRRRRATATTAPDTPVLRLVSHYRREFGKCRSMVRREGFTNPLCRSENAIDAARVWRRDPYSSRRPSSRSLCAGGASAASFSMPTARAATVRPSTPPPASTPRTPRPAPPSYLVHDRRQPLVEERVDAARADLPVAPAEHRRLTGHEPTGARRRKLYPFGTFSVRDRGLHPAREEVVGVIVPEHDLQTGRSVHPERIHWSLGNAPRFSNCMRDVRHKGTMWPLAGRWPSAGPAEDTGSGDRTATGPVVAKRPFWRVRQMISRAFSWTTSTPMSLSDVESSDKTLLER